MTLKIFKGVIICQPFLFVARGFSRINVFRHAHVRDTFFLVILTRPISTDKNTDNFSSDQNQKKFKVDPAGFAVLGVFSFTGKTKS